MSAFKTHGAFGAAWPLLLVLVAGGGCGTPSGVTPQASAGKGYPARPQPAAAATKSSPPSPSPQPMASTPPAAAPVAPRPAVVAAPAPPPPQRPYEPPMPLEPAQSTSVSAPLPNAANTTAGGMRFAVQGVEPGDVLNIRSGPSAKHDVVGTIPPDGTGVVPVGGRIQIGASVWREVSYRGVRGWVNDKFLVQESNGRRR